MFFFFFTRSLLEKTLFVIYLRSLYVYTIIITYFTENICSSSISLLKMVLYFKLNVVLILFCTVFSISFHMNLNHTEQSYIQIINCHYKTWFLSITGSYVFELDIYIKSFFLSTNDREGTDSYN